jgi:hypothetical protein
VSERAGAGDAFLSKSEATHVLGFQEEHELVTWLTPKLAKLVPEISLQTVRSMLGLTGGGACCSRKPDLFLVPSSFWRKKKEEGDKGVLADWKLRDAVTVLVVAKMTALHDVIGQLVLGMRFLCKDAPLNLLRYGVALLQSDFYVLESRDASVATVEKCALTAPRGTRPAQKGVLPLHRVVCGAGKELQPFGRAIDTEWVSGNGRLWTRCELHA